MHSRITCAKVCERGVTLVEVLIAIVLVAIALGNIFAMTAQGLHSLRATRQVAASSRVLQQRIEMIRAKPWPEISSATALAFLMQTATESETELDGAGLLESVSISTPADPELSGAATGTFKVQRQNGTASIRTAGDLSTEPLLLIEVTAAWRNLRGTQQRQLRTLVCRTGLTRSGIFGSGFGQPSSP